MLVVNLHERHLGMDGNVCSGSADPRLRAAGFHSSNRSRLSAIKNIWPNFLAKSYFTGLVQRSFQSDHQSALFLNLNTDDLILSPTKSPLFFFYFRYSSRKQYSIYIVDFECIGFQEWVSYGLVWSLVLVVGAMSSRVNASKWQREDFPRSFDQPIKVEYFFIGRIKVTSEHCHGFVPFDLKIELLWQNDFSSIAIESREPLVLFSYFVIRSEEMAT